VSTHSKTTTLPLRNFALILINAINSISSLVPFFWLSMDVLFSTADTDLVITGKVDTTPPFPAGDRYAHGFEDFTDNATRIVGHGGSAPGTVARVDIFLDKGYTAVTLGNRDYDLAAGVVQKIRDLLTSK
jgi:hypothetical protein